MSRPRLRVESGDAHAVLEPEDVGLLGRANDCTMRIDDGRVSRHHARLTPTADGWLLEDLASTGGVWLAADRVERMLITEPVEVRLADPVSGPLLRLAPQEVTDSGPGQETQVLEAADRPVARRSDPSSTPARRPTGVLTVTHAPREKTRIGRASDNDIVVE